MAGGGLELAACRVIYLDVSRSYNPGVAVDVNELEKSEGIDKITLGVLGKHLDNVCFSVL
jgi:hypothetical protein